MKRTQGRDQAYASTHLLSSCVWPSSHGDIPGCPRCNTMSHGFDNCPKRVDMTVPGREYDAERYLIDIRATLPPVRTALSWPDIVVRQKYLSALRGCPATKAFVLERFNTDHKPFLNFHKECRHPFLEDPATASLEIIRQNLANLSKTERSSPQS